MFSKIVLIEWEDSVQPLPGWRYNDGAPPLEVVKCISVGFKIKEDDKIVMLAHNIGKIESSDGAQGSGFIRITKAATTRQEELTYVTSSFCPSSHPGSIQKQQVS